jgi:dienelactone hydrolase
MSCPKCFSGAIHSGTPTGKEVTLHGLPTYVAEPPGGTPKSIIVIVPDAFGWDFINSRIIADRMAKRCSARVYLPDFMGGTAVDPTVMEYMDTVFGNGWLVGKVSVLKHAQFPSETMLTKFTFIVWQELARSLTSSPS